MKNPEAPISGNRKLGVLARGGAAMAALALAACSASMDAKTSTHEHRVPTAKTASAVPEASTTPPEIPVVTPEQTQQSEYMKNQVQLAAESLALDVTYANSQQANPAGNVLSDQDGEGFTISFPASQPATSGPNYVLTAHFQAGDPNSPDQKNVDVISTVSNNVTSNGSTSALVFEKDITGGNWQITSASGITSNPQLSNTLYRTDPSYVMGNGDFLRLDDRTLESLATIADQDIHQAA